MIDILTTLTWKFDSINLTLIDFKSFIDLMGKSCMVSFSDIGFISWISRDWVLSIFVTFSKTPKSKIIKKNSIEREKAFNTYISLLLEFQSFSHRPGLRNLKNLKKMIRTITLLIKMICFLNFLFKWNTEFKMFVDLLNLFSKITILRLLLLLLLLILYGTKNFTLKLETRHKLLTKFLNTRNQLLTTFTNIKNWFLDEIPNVIWLCWILNIQTAKVIKTPFYSFQWIFKIDFLISNN